MAIILERQGNWTLNQGVDRSTDVAYNPASPYIEFRFNAQDLFTDKGPEVYIDMEVEGSFDNGTTWGHLVSGRCQGKVIPAPVPPFHPDYVPPGDPAFPARELYCGVKVTWGASTRPDRVRIKFDLVNNGNPQWNAIQLTDYTVEDGL